MQDTFQPHWEILREFQDSDFYRSAWEQFKSSKSPKKEWEIVEVFCEGSDPVPAYQPEGWTKEWVEGQIKLGGLQIHSVRRLSDDWTVSLKDKVKTVSGKIGTIQAINADGHILFSDITGLEHITTIQKLPQPILTTSDGVEIYNWKDFQPAIVFPDFSIKINATGDYWVSAKAGYPNSKIFSTRQVAEEYILNNRPLLSLNDVKEAWNKGRSFVGTDWLLEQLTILVKQKLNQ